MGELTVCLPASPGFGQVLQDRLRLVLLDGLGHHVQNIVHYRSAKLKVVVRLDTLLRHRLRDALAVTTFELTGQ